jgi:signal transduction histidine kinase
MRAVGTRRSFFSTGIVARLILIFTIVLAPAVVVIGVGEVDRYEAAAARIAEDVDREAVRLHARVEHQLHSVENLLTGIARMSAVREYAGRACDELFYPVLASMRVLSALDLLDRQGNTRCGDPLLAQSVPPLDFFVRNRVMFWVGEWTFDRWRPSGVLPVATIVYDPFNAALGVLAAAIDLHSLSVELGDHVLPENAVMAIADRAGNLLVSRPEVAPLGGQPLSAARQEAKRAGGPITAVLDGTERLISFARPPAVLAYNLKVGVGLDKSPLTAAHERLWRELVLVVFLLAAAVALAFAVGQALIKKPIEGLVMAAGEFALGHWSARPRSTGRNSELADLSEAFTSMAEAVALRETELTRAKQAAEGATAAKSSFLANMSHELRTPLNAIIGFSELMKDRHLGPISPRYQEYAADIHASGQHLLSVINDVLDLSKVEAGYVDLHDEPLDLGETLQACERLLAERATRAGVAVSVHVATDLPVVQADPLRMRQVVLNLLSNAIKFTPSGGSVRMTGAHAPDGGALIRVVDTGIGMVPEDIPLALQPFQQLDSALNRRFEGTGLGLPLAQQLVERHGGKLRIESAPGAGTRVEIWLPASRVLESAA